MVKARKIQLKSHSLIEAYQRLLGNKVHFHFSLTLFAVTVSIPMVEEVVIGARLLGCVWMFNIALATLLCLMITFHADEELLKATH